MNRRLIVSSIIIIAFALYIKVFPFHEIVPMKKAFDEFPLQWKGWEGKAYYFDDKVLDKLRASEYMAREYKKGDNVINLYIGYYGAQKEGAQIHSPKHCLPGGGWFRLSEKTRSFNIDGVGKIDVTEAVYRKGTEREVFIYWYQIKDAFITNEYVLKLYMILNSVRYGRNDAAFIRFSTPVEKDKGEAKFVLEAAIQDFLPLLAGYLPE
ncbi:MAG: EpsI family protein [Nitrospiraceae bacterium]|nr:MAG: EpsI family protein [Nitrospiraceae bacterium]